MLSGARCRAKHCACIHAPIRSSQRPSGGSYNYYHPLKIFFKEVLHTYAKIGTNHNSPVSAHKLNQPVGAAPRLKNRTTDIIPKASVIKEKTDKLDFLKILNFCVSKDSIKKVKRQQTGWGEYLKSYI